VHPADLIGRRPACNPGKCLLSCREMGRRRLHRSHCSGGCILRSKGMRSGTGWHADQLGNRAVADVPKLLPEYEPSVGAFLRTLATYWGHETNDPAKVAQVILHLATKEQLPPHLLLGSDAVRYARAAEDKRESDAKAWLEVSASTDAEGEQDQPALEL